MLRCARAPHRTCAAEKRIICNLEQTHSAQSSAVRLYMLVANLEQGPLRCGLDLHMGLHRRDHGLVLLASCWIQIRDENARRNAARGANLHAWVRFLGRVPNPQGDDDLIQLTRTWMSRQHLRWHASTKRDLIRTLWGYGTCIKA